MTIEEAINTYRNHRYLPPSYHINWLKENFNPILKNINTRSNINWACGNCVKSNMNTLISWLDNQQNIKQCQ